MVQSFHTFNKIVNPVNSAPEILAKFGERIAKGSFKACDILLHHRKRHKSINPLFNLRTGCFYPAGRRLDAPGHTVIVENEITES